MEAEETRRHRRTVRLAGYDYSAPGAYLVTLCVQARLCLFGDPDSGDMRLNAAGKLVCDLCLALPERHPYIHLDAWVIMPNHTCTASSSSTKTL